VNPKAPVTSNYYSASAEPHEQAKDDGTLSQQKPFLLRDDRTL
jgi:hypothetical protein